MIRQRHNLPSLLALLAVASASASFSAEDAKLQARKRAREAMVQSAAIDRALSKELPDELKALPVFGEIDWQVKEMPFIGKGPHAGISGAGMTELNGQIYLAGGFIPEGDETQDLGRRSSRWVWRYDPKSDQWTQLPDLPSRREYTRALATDDAFYVLGGGVQGKPFMASADVFRLDPGKEPLAWQAAPSLTVPRTHMAVDRVGHYLIVAGGNKYDIAEKGYSVNTIQSVTDVFDLTKPDKGWQQRAPIPGTPRGWSASAVVGDKFYMLGGVTWTAKARERLRETLSYDPAKNEWKHLADFPFLISGWEAATCAGRYIIAVGGAGARWNDLPFVYDTKTDQWLRIPSPLPPGGMFNDPGVCIIGDTICVAGGEGPGGSHFNHFLVGKIKPRSLAAAVIETKVISQQPHFYHGWPTLTRRSNGDLMLVYSGGRDYHVCPFGRLELLSSKDDGATWTMPRVLSDSAIDDRDSGILETSKGTLLVTTFNSFAYQIHMNSPERLIIPTFGDEAAPMLKRWHTMDAATTQEQKVADSGYWMLRSTDGGLNWSPRYRVPGFSPHGPVNLSGGRLFYAAANGRQAVALVSDDDGLTWNQLSEMPVRAGELYAVQAADGAIIVHVRDKIPTPKGTVQNTAQTISTDGGKTWSEKVKVADGYPSHLLRLRDGTLLMMYSWRSTPFGIRGKFSTDHGRSWSNEFILTDDAATWDLGYPSSVELADSSLLTVWYETPHDSHKAVLKQARWTLRK